MINTALIVLFLKIVEKFVRSNEIDNLDSLRRRPGTMMIFRKIDVTLYKNYSNQGSYISKYKSNCYFAFIMSKTDVSNNNHCTSCLRKSKTVEMEMRTCFFSEVKNTFSTLDRNI